MNEEIVATERVAPDTKWFLPNPKSVQLWHIAYGCARAFVAVLQRWQVRKYPNFTTV